MSRYHALAAFSPAPGALWELELTVGETITLVDGDAPPGWLVVSRERDGMEGIVPESFLEEESEDEDGDGANDGGKEEADGDEGGAPAAPEAEAEAPPVDETMLERSARFRAEKLERESQRVCIVNFQPDPGSVFEVPMSVGEVIDLAEVAWEPPAGWLAVKREGTSSASGLGNLVGIVPITCVEMLPEPDEAGPTIEEQKEAAERALKVATQEKEETAQALATREEALRVENERAAQAEQLVATRETELSAAQKREEELEERLKTIDELQARNNDLHDEVDVLKKGGSEAALIELEVRRELRRLVQARAEQFDKQKRREDEEAAKRKDWESSQFESQRVYEDAEREYSRVQELWQHAEEAYRRAGFERDAARARLVEAERQRDEARARMLEVDEGPKAASERVLNELIPGVRALIEPEPEALKAIKEIVPHKLLLLAEEGAQAKLKAIEAKERPLREAAAAKVHMADRLRLSQNMIAGAGLKTDVPKVAPPDVGRVAASASMANYLDGGMKNYPANVGASSGANGVGGNDENVPLVAAEGESFSRVTPQSAPPPSIPPSAPATSPLTSAPPSDVPSPKRAQLSTHAWGPATAHAAVGSPHGSLAGRVLDLEQGTAMDHHHYPSSARPHTVPPVTAMGGATTGATDEIDRAIWRDSLPEKVRRETRSAAELVQALDAWHATNAQTVVDRQAGHGYGQAIQGAHASSQSMRAPPSLPIKATIPAMDSLSGMHQPPARCYVSASGVRSLGSSASAQRMPHSRSSGSCGHSASCGQLVASASTPHYEQRGVVMQQMYSDLLAQDDQPSQHERSATSMGAAATPGSGPGSGAWQGHAMRAARRSIDSHASRLRQARGYRGRELPQGWGKRLYGPSTELERQAHGQRGEF